MRETVTVRAKAITDFMRAEEMTNKAFYEGADINDRTLKRITDGKPVTLETALKIAAFMDKGIEEIVIGGLTPASPSNGSEGTFHARNPWKGVSWHDPTEYPGNKPGTFPNHRTNRRLVYSEPLFNGGSVWFEQNLYEVDSNGQEVWLTQAHTWVLVPLRMHVGSIDNRGFVFRRLDMYDPSPTGTHLDHVFEFFVNQDIRSYLSTEPGKRLPARHSQDCLFMRRVPIRDDIPFDYATALHLHGPLFQNTGVRIAQVWVEGESYVPGADQG